MTETITIPLNKLDLDPKNVRKTYSAEGIAALAGSIRADGYRLLQNLVVRKGDKKGRYFVTAGGRRRAALNLLAEKGEIAKDFPVECKERAGEDAKATSLAENVLREAMHPVDQYEAFRDLADEGKSVPDIAARFGTTETIVRRRLALGRVSPRLLEAHRNEDMTFDQLSAFTISDDHEAQERVWNELPTWNRYASNIRSALAGEGVRASDKRLKFLGGLDAYEAAGGTVKRDLFDDKEGGFAVDVVKLDALVAAKLESAAKAVKAEGWKWVEIMPDVSYDTFQTYGRRYPEQVPLSEAEQAELDQLTAEYDELAELIEAEAVDEGADAKIEEIDKRITALQDRTEVYAPEVLEISGAIVTLTNYGDVRIERGLVLPEDGRDDEADGDDKGGNGVEKPQEVGQPKVTHSAALVEDLTAQKTAALRVELANNHDIALAAVVHAMLLSVVYDYCSNVDSALQIRLTHEHIETSMKRRDACRAVAEFEGLRETWGDHIPGNPADLWEWCLQQNRDELLSLLAFAAAHSVNAVRKLHCYDRKGAFEHADQLGQALAVNMTKWFEPTGDSYFSHINRQSIEAVIREAKGDQAALAVKAAGKKLEAVGIAERMVVDSGWLPEPVRISIPAADTKRDDADFDEETPHPVAAE
ncbi:chromosome partitioning protein ParB (plasmid) [Aminobacter sp. Y103A]|uniref:ParB/RepB/Spo0J family partition protein n=1 Tax=Aminobacter sp. Y103A TaxID=1870862 RepID=UPI00257243CA|nr:ParB/RepB/Spo0J family partition protein [Aminobacter sp. SS-2016]BBD41441.1 chromosome partitioning protein ParB [Aminobacter sp. SS-2016]